MRTINAVLAGVFGAVLVGMATVVIAAMCFPVVADPQPGEVDRSWIVGVVGWTVSIAVGVWIGRRTWQRGTGAKESRP